MALQNNLESEIFQTINHGCEEAAKSFKKILGNQINSSAPKIQLFDQPSKLHEGTLHVFTTEIMGQVQGKSYLVFSDEEISQVTQFCHDNKIITSNLEMEVAILKEIDNILSATVITSIANKFNLGIYGNVPHYTKGEKAEIQASITDDIQANYTQNQQAKALVTTHFFIEQGMSLSPYFYWVVAGENSCFMN